MAFFHSLQRGCTSVSFFSSLEQPEGRREWRQGEESGEDCPIKRLLIHGYFLLKRDSFVYSTNINQFTEKMISSFISSWIKGSFKRPLISHHLIYIWLCVCSCGQRFWQWHKVCFFYTFLWFIEQQSQGFHTYRKTYWQINKTLVLAVRPLAKLLVTTVQQPLKG